MREPSDQPAPRPLGATLAVTPVKTVNSRDQIAYREQMSTLSRARLLVATTAAALVVPLGVTAPSAGAPAVGVTAKRATAQPPARQIDYHQWANQRQLSRGTFTGTRAVRGVLELAEPVGTRRYVDPHGYRTKRYAFGRWASPWREAGFAFDQLIPSWDATTPRDSWIQVQVRGRSESGRVSKWYTMANWAGHDRQFHRTSLGSQTDNLAQVDVDTLKTRYSMGFTTWQVRLTLLRKDGTKAVPRVDTIGAMTSSLPAADRVRTSIGRRRPVGPRAIRAPGIAIGKPAKSRAHGIEMRVVDGVPKVVEIAEAVAVPSLENVSDAPPGALDEQGDSREPRLHELVQRSLALAEDEVEVIRHDDVGEHVDIRSVDLLAEDAHGTRPHARREPREPGMEP